MIVNLFKKFGLTIILSFLAVMITLAQESVKNMGISVNQEFIEWVGQYPPVPNEAKKNNFFNWMGHLLFAEKSQPLVKPFSIFATNPDSLWILDQGNGNIFQIENVNSGSPKIIHSKDYIFSSLISLSAFKNNLLLFTDSKLNQIFSLNTTNNLIQSFGSSNLQQPTGIAYSAKNKKVWVAETAAHRISIFDDEGNLIDTVGKRGSLPGEFNFPTYLWIDSSEKVYVVDAMNFRIQIFDENGQLINSFGKAGDASGYFARPKGIATDTYGNIYVADALYHTIQIFNKKGEFLYNFGTQGNNNEEFWMPSGIFIDKNNYIYVADTYNSRIQIFKLNH